MQQQLKVVAILTANAALSSVLHMVLAGHRGLRVRAFDSAEALTTYMRIAPVDLLVCDFHLEDTDASVLVPNLRLNQGLVRPQFQVIALTRKIDSGLKAACIRAGIDEVLVKPMSPVHLEERVLARLETGPRHIRVGGYRGPERRGRVDLPAPVSAFRRYGDNVIPLFPVPVPTGPGRPVA